MAGRVKAAPKIHPKFDTPRAAETPQSTGVVNTNLATTIPEGTTYAGTYLQYQVLYRVDAVGHKIIVSPENLRGVCMNP